LEGCEVITGLLLLASWLIPEAAKLPEMKGPPLKTDDGVTIVLKQVEFHCVRMVFARKTPPSPKLNLMFGGAQENPAEFVIRMR
jgi:hypothetical protein